MNHPPHIEALLKKFRSNTCTAEELQELHSWLDKKAATGEPYSFNDEERALLKAKMREVIFAAVTTGASVTGINRLRPLKYAAAAAVLLIGAAVVFYFMNPAPVNRSGNCSRQHSKNSFTRWQVQYG